MSILSANELVATSFGKAIRGVLALNKHKPVNKQASQVSLYVLAYLYNLPDGPARDMLESILMTVDWMNVIERIKREDRLAEREANEALDKLLESAGR